MRTHKVPANGVIITGGLLVMLWIAIVMKDLDKNPTTQVVIDDASRKCNQFVEKSDDKRSCMFNLILSRCAKAGLDIEVCGYQRALLENP